MSPAFAGSIHREVENPATGEAQDREGPRPKEGTKKPELGVLFVHGIGTQVRGQTLADFGDPICRWVEERFHGIDFHWQHAGEPDTKRNAWQQELERAAWEEEGLAPSRDAIEQGEADAVSEPASEDPARDTLAARVSLAATTLGDQDGTGAPAHAEMVFRRLRSGGKVDTERWLLAESCWAETFAPPKFEDLARWSLQIIPWTLGAHFAARVRRRRDERKRAGTGLLSWAAWSWHMLLAAMAFGVALALSPLALAALTLLLLLALLRIPWLRAALQRVQLRIASTIGDSYVLLTRPVAAASIIGQTQRDLAWLAGRCQSIALVGHSQGGAVLHETLRKGRLPRNIRLLFTFGSGLKKLEQLRELAETGRALRLSAALTLGALIFFGLTALWLLSTQVGPRAGQAEPGGVLMVSTYSILFFAVLVAGLRDLLGGLDLPALDRWLEWLRSRSLDWADCYGSADPVSNGSLEATGAEDWSTEVTNVGSTLRDHTSYWSNEDEFVTLLVDRLCSARLRGETELELSTDLRTTKDRCKALAMQRRWRVRVARLLWWTAVTTTLGAVALAWPAWKNLGIFTLEQSLSWAARLLQQPEIQKTEFGVDWPAVGWLATALVPYWVARFLWSIWNRHEMRAAVRQFGPTSGVLPALAVAFWVQAIVAGIIFSKHLGQEPPMWFFYLSLLAVTIANAWLAVSLQRKIPEPRKGTLKSPASSERPTSMAQTLRMLSGLFQAVTGPFSVGLVLWLGVRWLSLKLQLPAIPLLGSAAHEIPALLVGAVVAVPFALGWLWSLRRGR